MTCPKCQGSMEQGFVPDHSENGNRLVSYWSPGEPKSSFWTGTKVRRQIPIGVFRCGSCGFLESYARAEFAAE